MTASPVRSACLLVLLSALAACGGSDSMSPSETVATVAVSPSAGTLDAIGATLQLSASAKDASGDVVSGATVTWSSSDDNVATVSPGGLVTAVDNGTVQIVATTSGIDGKADITVAQVVSTVSVDPASLELMVGETGQITASETDANDNPVEGRTVSWSSSDESVATINDAGLVSAVAAGTATITATVGSASADVDVTVTAPSPLTPGQDTTLSGTIAAAEVMILQGITVTLSGDVTLTATGSVTIAGSLTGDCVAASLDGKGDVTVSGSVTTTCSTPPTTGVLPGLSIVSAGLLTLDGATITSGGDLLVGNPGVGASAVTAAPSRAAPVGATAGAGCEVAGNPVLSAGSGASSEEPGTAGGAGGGLTFACSGSPDLGGLTLKAGDGGLGANQSVKGGDATATGAPGGPGGDLTVATDGGAITVGTSLSLIVGSGGPGGNGTATSQDPAVKATATGGAGGDAGELNMSVPLTGSGTVNLTLGVGGLGGYGRADAANGTESHFDGGAAEGHGGKGGDAPAVVPAGLSGTSPVLMTTAPEGGSGGFGAAEFGSGLDGTSDHPNGGNGGSLTAAGGAGGSVMDPTGQPGMGGELDLVLNHGGAGFNGCATFTAGGDGGRGGDMAGAPGVGGFDANGGNGTPGDVIYGQVAVGGGGGDGVTPGAGGPAGSNSVLELGTSIGGATSFKKGADGSGCHIDTQTSLMVTSDPNGHEEFIQYTSIQEIELSPNADGTITFTSNQSRWVELSGNLEGDSFTASGAGTVAGFPNIPVSMTGMLVRDSDNHVTGFTGTITIDGSMLPANGSGEHNDVTYDVTGTLSGG